MTREEKEKFYDEQIAPELAKLAKICKDNDLDIAAAVFNEGDIYRTFHLNNEIASKRIVRYSIMCNGNVDSLIKTLITDGEKFGHGSIYLDMIDRHLKEKSK